MSDMDTEPKVITPQMMRWVKNSCVYRLNQRMMSERQLFDALFRKARKKFAELDEQLARQLAQAGIDFCHQNKFLDDAGFANAKAASGIRSGKSRRRIAMDLSHKGIDGEVALAALQDMDDFEAAVNFARKRAFGPFRKVDLDDKRKAKEFSAFARNGFSSSLARRVLEMTLEDIGESLALPPKA